MKNTEQAVRKLGFEGAMVGILTRLWEGVPFKDEKKKWQKLGILKGNKLCMSKDELANPSLTLALWGMMWEGILSRSNNPRAEATASPRGIKDTG